MHRRLAPEILDTLPPHHPDAVHNRRDLRVINRLLGHHRWFVRTLPRLLHPGERALELGAGEGELGLRLARRGISVSGLDLWQRPKNWPAHGTWHAANLRTFDGYAQYPAVFGNLIFHQFSPPELADLGKQLRQTTRVIVACEPARRWRSQFLFRALAPALGFNYVTLHDAHVSIAAGFRGAELPVALGLDPGDWNVRCSANLFGAYRMVAIRRK